MTKKRHNKLPFYLRKLTPALAAGATFAFGATGAHAQDDGGERILVLGSNIPVVPSAAESGVSPVQTITRAEIDKSSVQTVEQIVKRLNVANAGGVPVSNNATGFTPGAASISLRGLGTEATLVLIDGRRVAPYPVGTGGTTAFIDLNSIPASAIESIEVLKDGASATYGADAVAGVVNINLRHDFRGVETTLRYGNTTDKDTSERTASIIFGLGDEKFSITGGANYYYRADSLHKDRDYSLVPAFLSSNASPGNFRVSQANAVAASGLDLATDLELEPEDNVFASPPLGTSGTAPASDYRYGFGRPNSFNYNEFAGSIPETERYGGFLNASYNIVPDKLTVYGDAFYQHVWTYNQLAPAATGNFDQPPGSVDLVIPATNPFNPFGQDISGGSRYRLAEFGNRVFEDTTDAYLFRAGLRGDKVLGTWSYDTAFNYSEIRTEALARQVSVSRFNQILDPASAIFDPTSSSFIGTTTPYNPFGDYKRPIASNSDTVNYATVRPKDKNKSSLASIDLRLANPELFMLPGGPVGLAIGGELRRERMSQNPDPLSLAGDIIGGSAASVTDGERDSYSVYIETNIPITSPEQKIPGLYSLEATAALRYEYFDNNGTDAAVPKFGIRWQPFDDSVTFRATYGEGYRQPSLFELFGSPTSGLLPLTDKVNDVFNPETNTLTLGNPALKPEESQSFNAGIVWSPKFVPGSLTVSVDFFWIRRENVVDKDEQKTLDREAAGNLLPGEAVLRDSNGDIIQVVAPFVNAFYYETQGIDIGIQYDTPAFNWGKLSFITQATYVDTFKDKEGGANRVGEGQDANSEDAYLQWKVIQRVAYTYKSFSLEATINYNDGFDEIDPDGLPYLRDGGPFEGDKAEVKSLTTLDLQASYTFGLREDTTATTMDKSGKNPVTTTIPAVKPWYHDTTVTVGCNNVTDEDPPYAYGYGGNATNYPSFIYDSTGRFYYISLSKKF